MTNNSVNIGDKVFIGGLMGKDFDEINHRVGKIDKIIASSSVDKLTYFAEINFGDYIIPIDFHYIFKLDSKGIDNDLTEQYLSPISHFFKKFRIVKYKLGLDEMGQAHCFCITMENNVESLTLTNLN